MKKDPMWRLTADEGKLLTDGKYMFKCVDVAPNDNPDRYQEIDVPEKEQKEGE